MGKLVEGERKQAQGIRTVIVREVVEAAGLFALLFLGCGLGGGAHLDTETSRNPSGRTAGSQGSTVYLVDFREGADSYLSGDFARSAEAFRRAALAAGDASRAAEASYWLARSELALGRLAAARAALENVLAYCSEGWIRSSALAALADVAIQQRRPAEALGALDRIEIEGLSGFFSTDEYLFRRARVLAALGRSEEASAIFGRVARMTWSALAEDAARMADSLRNSLYEARAGVYTERATAERVAALLRGRGLRADVEASSRLGREIFIVSLGRYKDRDEAEKASLDAAREGLPAHVWP